MIDLHEQYLVDETGAKKAVVISLEVWRGVLAKMEELDDIRAYDAAKSHPSDAVPFEQAVAEIERGSPD